MLSVKNFHWLSNFFIFLIMFKQKVPISDTCTYHKSKKNQVFAFYKHKFINIKHFTNPQRPYSFL
jgi:hypothetical protein